MTDRPKAHFDQTQRTTVRPAGNATQKIKAKPADKEKQDQRRATQFKTKTVTEGLGATSEKPRKGATN